MTRATLKVFLLTGLAATGWLGPGESGPARLEWASRPASVWERRA